ncbi:MAG: transcription-repair coupling factor, partial [Prevotella sp.]|nr:transcription-repair coupling factor [Prevotella sp.]
MNIQELEKLYAQLPQVSALAKELGKSSVKTIFLEGLLGSSAPMLFGSLSQKSIIPMLFILQDAEEAGYFYHDLTQLMGDHDVLFFPSSYRRAIKYAQRDAASEILRTEVLARLSSGKGGYIITCPEALAEMVVSKKNMDSKTLVLEKNQTISVTEIEKTLRGFGFREVDYVYEPGQFAVRGSIFDVYSFSCEYPYRIDFFGDDIDSIRTFEVEDQLSKDQRDRIEIVPELATVTNEKVPFLSFVPKEVVLVAKDYLYVRDAIDRAYQEGFSSQARMEQMEGATEMEQREIERQMRKESQLITGAQFMTDAEQFRRIEFGHRPSAQPQVTLHFHVTVQPLFHKNFDLLAQSFEDYLLQGYQIYILADSAKQTERLKEILNSLGTVLSESSPKDSERTVPSEFTPVDKTLHEGFADDDLRICVFTDHQIFDRFHKYNLKSDKARSGKMALTLKEIQQFEVGDFVVHVDHGVGKFGGLVRMPQGDGYQEMIKILYQHGDSIYVSIHSLYKVSK